MKRWVFAALLAACPAMTAGAQTVSPYPAITIPLKIDRVPGKPVWYSTGNPGIPGKGNEGNTSNAGFVVTSDGVVVFDALGTPSLGWALLQEIRKVTDKKIRYVVLSHYHADHIYGLQAFRDHTDALIVAQERSGEYKDNDEIADEKASQRLDQRRAVLSPWVDGNTRVVVPDITFNQRMGIALGDRRLTLLYAGPAHSSSDILMMVEPDGVLFAGDIVQNSRIPFMNSDDVSTVQWLHALDEVAKLDPKFIIPGHGRTSTEARQAIAFTRDYIQYLRDKMTAAVQNWTDFDVAYRETDWSKYRDLPAFASNNRGNAYRIYLELEQSQFKTDKP
ncbi:MAG TPA: MBL fold metallo-hydrolase [Bradyrhizobium sp.]|nr:MBL fold metallo-hydrolase [Bradyrhizobium sp.]